MNNEVLNHTDIPMGESFLIVNNGIDGLTVSTITAVSTLAVVVSNNFIESDGAVTVVSTVAG